MVKRGRKYRRKDVLTEEQKLEKERETARKKAEKARNRRSADKRRLAELERAEGLPPNKRQELEGEDKLEAVASQENGHSVPEESEQLVNDAKLRAIEAVRRRKRQRESARLRQAKHRKKKKYVVNRNVRKKLSARLN